MANESLISTDIDYTQSGKQIGVLRVPQSFNTAGWANYFIPIAVIQNGSGPTVLLSGGNHGDEYEGQVTLLNLVREIQPEQVQGRLIVLPMLNRPACVAGTRLSPLDGRNMNRAFPGQRNDTITGMIAHYVSSVLLPLADIVVDIHSGGRTLQFLPSVNMHELANQTQMDEMVRAANSWGAPYVFIYADVAGEGLLPSYAESLGKITLGTELGSAPQFGVEMLGIADRGVKNMLRMYGVLTDSPYTPPAPAPQLVAATDAADYVMAPVSGIFEPFLEMGDSVEVGQKLGQIHSTELPFADPVPVLAQTGGILFGRCGFPLTQQGACVATIVRPYTLPKE
ncbi:MAG: succinylglutamate desuccinylase/aspartoacylase family protein [Caldilineaceae bacterium]|nr:succinylglutamate desuccinylase/aspartoacylase family protein [Caldilineaceae bacterium]